MPHRVLLIAGDDAVAELARRALEGAGYDLAPPVDPDVDAVRAAVRRLDVGCIVLDGRLPGAEDLVGAVADPASGGAAPIPLILLAGDAPAGGAGAGAPPADEPTRWAGAFAVVPAPLDPARIARAVGRAIEARATPAAAPPPSADRDPLLTTLERLMAQPATDLDEALDQACQVLTGAFGVEKVDAWVYEPANDLLVARGVSDTPMGRKQRALRLDRFPRAEPTRVADVFGSGVPFLTGRADLDERVHEGVKRDLGVRSMLGVPLDVAGERRGVLLLADARPDLFTDDDRRFLATIAGWVGLVAHRAELVAQATERRQAEAAREEHVRVLSALLDRAPAAICVLQGPALRFTFANQTYVRLVGRDPVGLPAREAFPDIASQGFADLVEGVMRTGERYVGHEVPATFARRIDGVPETGYFDFVYEPLRAPDGRVDSVLMHAVEVTDQVLARRRAEELAAALAEERDRLALAMAAGRIGMWEWDLGTGAVRWTPELEAIYGLPPGAFGGRFADWAALAHPEDVGRATREVEEAARTGADFDTRFRIVRPDGRVRHVLGQARVVRDAEGRPARMVGVNVDVTEREEALAAAQAAVRARDRFLSIASHELRNPLAALSGHLQLLERRIARGESEPERLARSLGSLRQATDRLARLVEDLLDVSRLQTGQLALRRAPVDVESLVREAVERMGDRAPDRELRAELACAGCVVVADADRLHQVLDNLLENAAKYSPAGGAVRVGVAREAGGVLIRVTDEGIGLPPGAEEAIFRPFGRARNATDRQVPGLGLGLYVSRQIVDAHGGRLVAESAGEDRGTTFSLWLPADPAPAAGPPASP